MSPALASRFFTTELLGKPKYSCFVFCCFVLAVLGLCCFVGLPLVGESGGYSLVAVLGLLILVASLTAEHGL